MGGNDRAVCQGDQHVGQLSLLVGGLRGHQQNLIRNPFGKVAGHDGVGAGDDVANVDGHAQQTEGIEHPHITVGSLVSRKGCGRDEGILPHPGGGHLHASLNRRIKGQKLGGTGILIVEHANGGEILGMLTLTCNQGGRCIQTVGLPHLGIVDGGLDTQVQIGSGIENGIILVVGNTAGQINEGVDNIRLRRVGHVEVHGLVGVQIVVGVEGLVALVEQHQLIIVYRHAHSQALGDLLRGRACQIRPADQRADLSGIQGQGTVGVSGDNALDSRLQLTVGVILPAAQGEGVGLTGSQHLLDAAGRGVLRIIGELGCGELHGGHGRRGIYAGIGTGDGIRDLVRHHGFNGIGKGFGGLGRGILFAGDGAEQKSCQEDGKEQLRTVFHGVLPFNLGNL